MSQEFTQGDRVTWKSHGGDAEGEVLRKITAWRSTPHRLLGLRIRCA